MNGEPGQTSLRDFYAVFAAMGEKWLDLLLVGGQAANLWAGLRRAVGPNIGSDHYPLVVDFVLTAQKARQQPAPPNAAPPHRWADTLGDCERVSGGTCFMKPVTEAPEFDPRISDDSDARSRLELAFSSPLTLTLRTTTELLVLLVAVIATEPVSTGSAFSLGRHLRPIFPASDEKASHDTAACDGKKKTEPEQEKKTFQ